MCHMNCKFLSDVLSSFTNAMDYRPCENEDITSL